MKIVFTANGRCASAVVEPAGQPITAGSRGVPAEIHLSPDYDGLVVTAFFRPEYGAWPVVLGETPGTVTIPWEAMEKKSLTFDVGVVGKNGDGTIVIPTIWARAGKIVPATEDSGLEPGDPSADIGAQIVEQARAAAKKAEDAAAAAEDARDKMPRIVDGTWRVYNAVTESWEDTGIQAEGQDGVGISGAVLNANYTLTLTFTDGSSYTTPPIRGAQGERGPIGPPPDISIGTVTTGAAGSQAEATITGTPERPVLNLTIPRGDPGEVTQAEFDDLAVEVAQQKSAIEDLQALTNRKAGMLVDSVSGAIASFVPDSTIPNLLGVSVAVEPVQAGSGDPSPDNVRPISGWDAVELERTGVSLFEFLFTSDFGPLPYRVNGWNNTFSKTEIPTAFRGKTITYSIDFENSTETAENASARVWAWNGSELISTPSGNAIAPHNSGTSSLTWTIPSNATDIAFGVFLPVGAVARKPCVELGSTASAYHAYAGNRYTIALGQTVYGGRLDVTNGTLTVDRAMVDMGTLTYGHRESNGRHIFYTEGLNTAPCVSVSIPINAICPIYRAVAQNVTWVNYDMSYYYVGNTRIDIVNNAYSDAATFKTAMSGVQLVYELATPIEIQLDPVTISTISGQTNNVWADAGDVTVEYAADLKAYIDSKIAAAVAALS